MLEAQRPACMHMHAMAATRQKEEVMFTKQSLTIFNYADPSLLPPSPADGQIVGGRVARGGAGGGRRRCRVHRVVRVHLGEAHAVRRVGRVRQHARPAAAAAQL